MIKRGATRPSHRANQSRDHDHVTAFPKVLNSAKQPCKPVSTRPRDRATLSLDLGQVIVQITLPTRPCTNTEPFKLVSKLVRGLGARPPVLSPVPLQAIHSHVSHSTQSANSQPTLHRSTLKGRIRQPHILSQSNETQTQPLETSGAPQEGRQTKEKEELLSAHLRGYQLTEIAEETSFKFLRCQRPEVARKIIAKGLQYPKVTQQSHNISRSVRRHMIQD